MTQQDPRWWLYSQNDPRWNPGVGQPAPPPAPLNELQQGGANLNQFLTGLANYFAGGSQAAPWNSANQNLTGFFNELARGNPTLAFNTLNRGLTSTANQRPSPPPGFSTGGQVPRLGPPFQSQAPFQEYPAWNMQTPPPSVGSGQPGPAWNPGYLQGRPQSWGVQQAAGPAGAPAGAGGGLNPNGGPWWTGPPSLSRYARCVTRRTSTAIT